MILIMLYYLYLKIIGLLTKIIFKEDYLKEKREELKEELIQYLTT